MAEGFYTYIFAISVFFAFLDSYGIGANDVANSFATAVGSKTLTLLQACTLASITEFSGALLMGSEVSNTVRSRIIKTDEYDSNPGALMLGMLCSLIGSSTWVIAATRYGMPVSTTHATIGSIIGFAVASFGADVVNWGYTNNGFASIVTSWFVSPALSAVIAALIYLLTKALILRYDPKKAYRRGIRLIPAYFTVTFAIETMFIVWKGSPRLGLQNLAGWKIAVITVAVALTMGTLARVVLVPWLRRRIEKREDLRWYHVPVVHCVQRPVLEPLTETDFEVEEETPTTVINIKKQGDSMGAGETMREPTLNMPAIRTHDQIQLQAQLEAQGESQNQTTDLNPCTNLSSGDDIDDAFTITRYKSPSYSVRDTIGHNSSRLMTRDLDGDPLDDQISPNFISQAVHNMKKFIAKGYTAEVADYNIQEHLVKAARHYDSDVEELFKSLQVLTSSLASFAHGSNDVANAVGPLSTVYYIWQNGQVADSAVPVDIWVLAYGGVGIAIGVWTYGYKIMRALGNQITYHCPSRGFSMELGATLTVLIASKVGIPVSTTHCITGATVGVGLCNGHLRAVNWRTLLIIFGGWIITCPVTGLISGLIFAICANSPII